MVFTEARWSYLLSLSLPLSYRASLAALLFLSAVLLPLSFCSLALLSLSRPLSHSCTHTHTRTFSQIPSALLLIWIWSDGKPNWQHWQQKQTAYLSLLGQYGSSSDTRAAASIWLVTMMINWTFVDCHFPCVCVCEVVCVSICVCLPSPYMCEHAVKWWNVQKCWN